MRKGRNPFWQQAQKTGLQKEPSGWRSFRRYGLGLGSRVRVLRFRLGFGAQDIGAAVDGRSPEPLKLQCAVVPAVQYL